MPIEQPSELHTPHLGDTRIGDEHGHVQIWHACIDCGKQRWVWRKKGAPQSPRCRSCGARVRYGSHPHLRGPQHPNWKGGRRIDRQRGYIYVLVQPDDFFYPMANNGGYVLEHRLVMAKHLGRCLHAWELVHHKGVKYPVESIDNRQHNVINNLQLVTDDRHKQITVLENKIERLRRSVKTLKAENNDLCKSLRLLQWRAGCANELEESGFQIRRTAGANEH